MKFTFAAGARPVQGYTIKRGLGRGGFGEVYHAVSDGGKEVALKVVQRHLDVELRGVGQCLNLKHPHLVLVYDIYKTETDDYWVVMEYVAGESLDQVIARHPQGMPGHEARAWLRGICAGVGYLHERGIVHRDLKPGNLFIENGVVKIGDYGLSKFISASRRSGQTESVGSVHYMAPEMSMGRYGKEVDQYALGILLYEMLTGRVPFDGETPGEILMKHLVAEPDLGALAEPYRSVVARLLAKDPGRRYPSVEAMLADLGDEVPAAPKARPGREARPKGAGFDRAKVVKFLIENGMEMRNIERVLSALGEDADRGKVKALKVLVENGREMADIEQVLRAFDACGGPGSRGKLRAVEVLVENGMAAGDIAQVLTALDDEPDGPEDRESPGKLRAVEVLVENGMDAGESIARVLRALGTYPEQDVPGKVRVLEILAENGAGAGDIEQVLRAFDAYPGCSLPGRAKAVGMLVDNGVEAADIARVVRALGEFPDRELPGKLPALEALVENGMEVTGVERVLRALGECPEQELPGQVTVVASMVENGMAAEDIERMIRACRRAARGV